MPKQTTLTTETVIAAIVFTDVEAFTPKMAADERHTLVLLERDFQLMRALCAKSGGRVLKTLGDGLLLYFRRAEQAVLWAIACQKALARAAAQDPAQNSLSHRIGIHFGEVFFNGRDVMGAGVNLAARLQTLAAPGGICLSQAAYEAVRQRLALTVTHLASRSLKGLGEPITAYAIAPPAQAARPPGVFIAYRATEPDYSLAQQFYRALEQAGYRAFLAGENLRLGQDWVQRIEQELQCCDYLLVLLSELALHSEMVAEEVQRARELSRQHPAGKPILLPIRVALPLAAPLGYPLQDYLDRIQQRCWRSPADTAPLITEVLEILATGREPEPTPLPAAELPITAPSIARPAPAAAPELPEGQVEVTSAFYLERPPLEDRARETILQPGALLCIKAPRQMGKTSLLAQILHYARRQGYGSLSLSFQLAERRLLEDLDRFLQWFCVSISRRLRLPNRLADYWDEIFGSKDNCTAYFEEHLLASLDQPLVLGLDEVDCIFQYPELAADFLGLLRAWHEEAKNRAIWKNLRLAIVHSTEVYVPMDVNQSPFNVGLSLELPEFNREQVGELARRHGLAWQEEVDQLMQMVGGHPYLTRLALYAIARQDLTLTELLIQAPTEAGLYSDHLRRHLWQLRQRPALAAAMQAVAHSATPIRLAPELSFKLHSMGLIAHQGKAVQPRCELYRRYFSDRLEPPGP